MVTTLETLAIIPSGHEECEPVWNSQATVAEVAISGGYGPVILTRRVLSPDVCPQDILTVDWKEKAAAFHPAYLPALTSFCPPSLCWQHFSRKRIFMFSIVQRICLSLPHFRTSSTYAL